jgi:TRAP-type uncharacterized transport system fused permease subunit
MEIFFFSMVGLYVFAAAFQGHLETDHNMPLRLVMGAIAIMLLWPNATLLHWLSLVAFIIIFIWDWQRARKAGRHIA